MYICLVEGLFVFHSFVNSPYVTVGYFACYFHLDLFFLYSTHPSWWFKSITDTPAKLEALRILQKDFIVHLVWIGGFTAWFV